MSDKIPADILMLTAKIVSAHVANNAIAAEAIPSLIKLVYHSLTTVGEVEVKPEARAPAVPVKKSVFPAARLPDGGAGLRLAPVDASQKIRLGT